MSYNNISAMIASGAEFIAQASKNYVTAAEPAALDLGSAIEVGYVAGRDAGKPADQRGRWRVTQDTMPLTGKRKKDPIHTLRRVFVHYTATAPSRGPWR